uniref:MurNAc-LAA domain-containing protein n=1 Tax=candidate division WOR-3 bacterium TaxID=2052148 RepID=A0A7C3N516_UNCW3
MKERFQGILKITGNLFRLQTFLILFICLYIHSENYFEINKNGKVDSLQIQNFEGIEYVDLNILVNLLNGKIKFKKVQEEITVETEKNYAILLINSPFVKVGGNTYKISYTPILKEQQIFFPVKGIKQIFEKLLPNETVFLDYSIKYFEKLSLKKIKEDETSITLLFNKTPQTSYELTQRDIILFFKDCFINEDSFRIKNSKNLIRVAQPINDEDGSTYIITFSPEFLFDTLLLFDDSIKINFIKLKKSDNINQPQTIRTIIIDPGHGGKDPGAIGYNGTKEKNLNLDMALRLKDKIKANLSGIDVVLTRYDDRFLSLKDRTNFANKYKNSLFVSIHCNASKNTEAKGFETYFLSTAKTDWERAVEARENASVTFDLPETEKKGIDFIFFDLAQNEFLQESSRLAELVQTKFEKKYQDCERGVRQAGFYVLKGNFMPAILVECGYISNKEEEKKLNNKSYRDELTQLIFEGIRDFIKEHEKKFTK